MSRFKALNRPVHILIGQKKDAVKRISIQPLSLLAIALFIIALIFVEGKHVLMADNPPEQQQNPSTLQQQQQRLSAKLAEAEALLSLRDAQIESMQEQLQQDRRKMQQMRRRLDLFDQVLAARKVAGVHFLRPGATWKNDRAIAYQLILVKGKNYPRWIIGHLDFTVADADGHVSSLSPTKQPNNGSKIEMTTQSFIEGTLPWQQKWPPETLTITLINHQGRNKGTITMPIAHPQTGEKDVISDNSNTLKPSPARKPEKGESHD